MIPYYYARIFAFVYVAWDVPCVIQKAPAFIKTKFTETLFGIYFAP